MDHLFTYLVGAALCTLAIYGLRAATRGRSRLPLPPGPRGLPVIGNLLDLPAQKTGQIGQFFHKLGLEYGPVFSMTVLGQPWIVINEHDMAQELFSKRAANYNDRPGNGLLDLVEETGWPRLMAMVNYNADYRAQHRALASGMAAVHAPRWRGVLDLEMTQFLRDLLLERSTSADSTVDSHRLDRHILRAHASFIYSLFFGASIPRLDSALLRDHEQHLAGGSVSLVFDTTPLDLMLDLVPALKHVPRLLSPWRRRVEAVIALEKEKAGSLVTHVRQFPGWSLYSHMLSHAERNGLSDETVVQTSTTAMLAGIETTPSGIMWLTVAALRAKTCGDSWLHKARAELDAVVGHDRLPDMEDRTALPVMEAIMREVLRWRPVLPASFPHRVASDDEFRGMRMPGGALIFPNLWGIGRQVSLFGPDGDAFVPERWFEDRDMQNGKLRTDLPMPAFGYGRRRCWGSRIGEEGSWLFMARLLWAFDFIPVEGQPVDETAFHMHVLSVCPMPYRMHLVPRGPWVEQVVEKAFQEAEKDLASILKV